MFDKVCHFYNTVEKYSKINNSSKTMFNYCTFMKRIASKDVLILVLGNICVSELKNIIHYYFYNITFIKFNVFKKYLQEND